MARKSLSLVARQLPVHPRVVQGRTHRVCPLSCTSAAAERVFSLVDSMFGRDQITALADQVQAGVMSHDALQQARGRHGSVERVALSPL